MPNETNAAEERVRAAAERRRKMKTDGFDAAYGHVKDPARIAGDDEYALADFALEHLAELDPLPIDEAWLRSIGFDRSGLGFDSPMTDKPDSPWVKVFLDEHRGRTEVYRGHVNGITTRGQLIRLLTALNITTTGAGVK